MEITQISPLGKSRYQVYVDGALAFVLYKGELRRFSLKEGECLSPEAHDEIMTDILPKRAKARALHLLTKRSYTTAGLRQKLQEGGYPSCVIQKALDYVASYHYTDDALYAKTYLETYASSRSKRRLAQDLEKKGISKEIFHEAWEALQEAGMVQDEEGMIKALMEKRRFNPETADAADTRRMVAFLQRRGFSYSAIAKLLRE